MDAFISHASENSELAVKIEKLFEEKGLKIWLDHSDIRLGVLLRDELQAEIRKSRTLILLWSEPASASRWVPAEILMAFHLNRFIIPCMKGDGTKELNKTTGKVKSGSKGFILLLGRKKVRL